MEVGDGGWIEGIVGGRGKEVKNGTNKQNNNQPFYLAPSRLSFSFSCARLILGGTSSASDL